MNWMRVGAALSITAGLVLLGITSGFILVYTDGPGGGVCVGTLTLYWDSVDGVAGLHLTHTPGSWLPGRNY